MGLYKNKYRIKSNRLSNWDYSSAGYYFVTICTQNKICHFGNITQSLINPSPVGEIAYKYWVEIPKHFNNVDIDEFMIMPNHIHGIIAIHDTDRRDVACNVSTPNPDFHSHISPKPNSLPTIIRSYKSAITKWCNENDLPFKWQHNYHEHIIRDEKELDRIREYIINNPANWDKDENFIK